MSKLRPVAPPERLGDRTYQALRGAILRGDLAPGERLVEADLAAQLNVSRTPVRDALRRLAAEQLVRPVQSGRYEVVRLGHVEVEELYQCRIALEGMAARLAAERAGGADPQMQANLEGMAAAYARGDLESVRDLNTRFHERLLQLAGNATLAELADQIRSRTLLVRHMGLHAHEDPHYVLDQHRQIAAAVAAGDGVQAEALTREHIAANLNKVVDALRKSMRG